MHRLQTYRLVHKALIGALDQWGIEAAIYAPHCTPHAPREVDSVTRSVGSKEDALTRSVRSTIRQPFLCFQRRSPGDVLVGGAKVAGSAQRRCRGAVLQHGSLLLARSHAAPELDGLKELSGRAISVEELIQAWLERLAEALGITCRRSDLSNADRCRAARLAAEKYASANWTNIELNRR